MYSLIWNIAVKEYEEAILNDFQSYFLLLIGNNLIFIEYSSGMCILKYKFAFVNK